VSDDREYLEKNSNYNVIATHCIQKSSAMAKEGRFVESQAYAKNWNRKMKVNMNSEEQVTSN